MVLILGQGLAGTLLAWELERAGLPFQIVDAGEVPAASAVSAGIINPITGQRLVKTWRIDAWLPLARAAYREIERELGVPLWHEMRVRRGFANDRERAIFAEKNARGELAPYAGEADAEGFWIRDAARVDFPALLTGSRERWLRQGRLLAAADEREFELVIHCTGAAIAQKEAFSFVPWEFSKGEILDLAVEGLARDVILNRREWVLPVTATTAWVGATHEPRRRDREPTAAARVRLEASARALLADRPFRVSGQRVGIRVNLPDKRPVAGRHPVHPRLGLLNGLAAKGALWAPALARQWVAHLREGAGFDPEVDLSRFGLRGPAN